MLGASVSCCSAIQNKMSLTIIQYQCVHNNFAGSLYTGPLAVVWLGRIFFFEWTVVIKWEDVIQVRKHDDGVRIEVSTPKPATYDFQQLFNLDKVWSSLVSLHNDTILDTPRRAPTPRQITRGLRRMSSDPLRMSKYFNFDEEPAICQDTPSYKSPPGRVSRTVSAPLSIQDSTEPVVASTGDKATLEKQWSVVLEDTTAYAETAVEVSEVGHDIVFAT
jgi:hypothetical protein